MGDPRRCPRLGYSHLPFGWGLLWRWTAHEAQISQWELFRRSVLQNWLGCIPMVIAAVLIRRQTWWASGANTFLMLAESAVVAVIGAAGLWRLSLRKDERDLIASKLKRALRLRTKSSGV